MVPFAFLCTNQAGAISFPVMKSILLTTALLAVLAFGNAAQAAPKTILYAAVGTEIAQYQLDPRTATLTKQTSVTLPENVQEAWLHKFPTSTFLYVAWSNGGASYAAPRNNHHGLTAFRLDPQTGALLPDGQPAALPARAIFTTVSPDGTNIITAHNDPSSLTVHRILPDGTLGPRVPQPASLDFGIYGHQVRADPSGKTVILVTRGNGPTPAKPEDPGAIKVFSFKDGILSNNESIAPNRGFGYQVRHLDFHPSGKWAFVTLERQNQLQVYARNPDGTLGAAPLFTRSTLMPTTKADPSQTAAAIHVHPSGRFVYVTNRATEAGGENTLAVFAINQTTGEPTLIQTIDTHGQTPRTFTLDPAGTLLAVANQTGSLALFRIQANGHLAFIHKTDVETGPDKSLFWTAIVTLP